MSKLQYKSFDEISSDPAKLVDFAANLKTLFEEKNQALGKFSFQGFVGDVNNVSVGGKPFSIAGHLYNLSNRDFELDDMKPEQLRQLHVAGTILLKLEPTWDIAQYMGDPSLGDKLEQMRQLAPVDGLAARAVGALNRPPEHTVKTGLLM